MTQKSWKTPVLVIADDFTGANDAGSGLAKAGARVHVLLSSEAPLDVAAADVWVISTDSRAVSAAEAAARTEAVVRRHQDFIAQGWLFKKIDSTLRGNIGAEVRAALAASGKQRALIVPAVPRLGRVTRRGEVQVNGVPLAETEYASDPKNAGDQRAGVNAAWDRGQGDRSRRAAQRSFCRAAGGAAGRGGDRCGKRERHCAYPGRRRAA
ncbi:four-carbon acid sugar kinase family protein [Pantoea tagorei]